MCFIVYFTLAPDLLILTDPLTFWDAYLVSRNKSRHALFDGHPKGIVLLYPRSERSIFIHIHPILFNEPLVFQTTKRLASPTNCDWLTDHDGVSSNWWGWALPALTQMPKQKAPYLHRQSFISLHYYLYCEMVRAANPLNVLHGCSIWGGSNQIYEAAGCSVMSWLQKTPLKSKASVKPL